jgi:hypothetical protein
VPTPSGNSTGLELSNGFVSILLNTANPSITAVHADFLGTGNYSSTNIFSKPYALEVEDASGVHSSIDATGSVVTILSNTTELVSVMLSGVGVGQVTESWTISLKQGARSYELNTTAQIESDMTVKSIRHNMGFSAVSIYGLFAKGVVQMKNAKSSNNHFGSNGTIHRLYAMGGGSSIDISYGSQADNHILLSGGDSGLHEEMVTNARPTDLDKWGGGWESAPLATVLKGQTFHISSTITANDRNFPAGGLTSGPNLPVRDLEAYLTGVYGSSPGCLCSYPDEVAKVGVPTSML